MEKDIIKAYEDPSIGLGGAPALLKKLKGKYPNLKLKQVKDVLNQNEGYQVSQNVIREFPTRPIIVARPDELWQADLVFMDVPQGAPAKDNDGIKYLLTVIDVFTKYAWVKPLKNKEAQTVTNAFEQILEEGRKPEKLQVDKGSEFYNKIFEALMTKNKIHMYSSNSDHKAAVVERFNRTLKQRMTKLFEVNQNFRYIDDLQKLVKNYNTTYHSTIKMTPEEASKKENTLKVFNNLFDNFLDDDDEKPKAKFKVGDYVRIPSAKTIFSKEGTGKWTIEIFKINLVKNTKPITYGIEDLKEEPIEGSYYEQELQKVPPQVIDQPFRIEKIIETKGKGKNKKAFVKYLGYPDKFNEWIFYDDIS